MSKKKFLAFFFSMLTFLLACVNNDPKYPKEVDPDDIYFDYTIVGDEESNNITVKLQYRIGGSGGKTSLIPYPGNVELDGEAMVADSSRMNGFWYEVNRPLDEFAGEHHLAITNNTGTYKQAFEYNLISLKTEVPRIVHRDDLIFEFDGLSTGDQVRVLLTDTGFYTRGIDRIDTVKDGQIMVSRRDLDNVKDGPVTIDFYWEIERELEETRGRLAISFGLRRVFELKDSTVHPPPAKTDGG